MAELARFADTPPPPKGRVVVPNQPRWHERLAAGAIVGLLRLVALSIRFRWNDRSGLFADAMPEQVIFSVWHNRFALALVAYRRYVAHQRQPKRRLAALVSASRDGGLLASALELFDVQPVRGSTSRRGQQALLELTTAAERGLDLAITPDGPRGPCYVAQPGVVSLAQVTGLPIVPVTYHLNWKRQLKSWDRFQVPLPFARCTLEIGELLRVPRDASDDEREHLRQVLEKRLRELTRD
jgi:lysophospholipid acyltransferase (LPLAT)-like uncharacterized protein